MKLNKKVILRVLGAQWSAFGFETNSTPPGNQQAATGEARGHAPRVDS